MGSPVLSPSSRLGGPSGSSFPCSGVDHVLALGLFRLSLQVFKSDCYLHICALAPTVCFEFLSRQGPLHLAAFSLSPRTMTDVTEELLKRHSSVKPMVGLSQHFSGCQTYVFKKTGRGKWGMPSLLVSWDGPAWSPSVKYRSSLARMVCKGSTLSSLLTRTSWVCPIIGLTVNK